MKILFLGSPLFSRVVLEKMLEAGLNVVGVVTQPDRPSGRGHKLVPTEIKTFALEKNIPVYQFEKISRAMDEVRKIDYDYAITASFGQILSEEFLSHRPCINVHPSLLPKYRGGTPIQSALLNGDKVTGVTIMKVVKAVDAGDILLQRKVEIADEDDCDSLMQKCAQVGGEMAVEAFTLIESGKAKFTPQDESKATFVKLIQKEDGLLDFNRTASQLVNQVRALGGKPGCYFTLGEDVIKVSKLRDASSEFVGAPNEILCAKKRFVIGCKNGAVEILTAQAPSGKMLSARDFLNGFKVEGKKIKC